MDPVANIQQQREIAAEITALWDGCDDSGDLSREDADQVAEAANRLAELVLALDEWRRKGGFDPYGVTA